MFPPLKFKCIFTSELSAFSCNNSEWIEPSGDLQQIRILKLFAWDDPYLFLLWRWKSACKEDVPWLSPLHPVGEASSSAAQGEASPPHLFMESQWWFTELELAWSRATYHLFPLPDPSNISHSSSSSLALVIELFLLTQWVMSKSTHI